MNTLAVSSIVASGRVEIANTRRQALTIAKARIVLVGGLFSVMAVIALLRVVYLGLFEGTPANASDLGLTPQRGDIVDRNGVPLARAFPAYALWYNPDALGDSGTPLVRPVKEVAIALNQIFPDMDVAQTAARLASGRPGYLRRRILPEEANRIHALGEPALEFPRETERFYPQGSLAAHVLGFVGADGHGHVGMEGVFDKRLTDPATRGTPAMLSLDYFPNAKAANMHWDKSIAELPTQPGSLDSLQVQLETIVSTLQHTLQHADKLITHLDREVAPELTDTLRDARKTLDQANKVLSSDAPLQQEMRDTLREVGRASSAVRNLADLLERQPEALLKGKKDD